MILKKYRNFVNLTEMWLSFYSVRIVQSGSSWK
uniref:Uncharacterized protein n=1 Tax=Anguilla anguilla TaxID=7936 RepID=A0A0E9U6W1_ANGAN